MVRQALCGAAGVLLMAALLGGCLGGQTGQPSSLECGPAELSAAAAWSGTTVGAASATFARTYEAPLLWQEEPRGMATHTAVALEDSLRLSIAYDGGSAERNCSDQLTVPVTVTLSTSDSGISETGDARLVLSGPGGSLTANLTYDSKRVTLYASLVEAGAAVSFKGGVDSLAIGLPGASASFALEP